ncbi:endolytic transglycosylase MltG [Pseudoalteromonas xiamenensis]
MIKKILLAVVCCVVATLIYLCLMINTVKTERLIAPQGSLFDVHAGQGALSVCERWEKLGWIQQCWRYRVFFKLFPLEGGMQKGLYELSSMPVFEAYNMILKGKQKQFSFTIIEGETFSQVLHKMKSSPYLEFDFNPDESALEYEGWLLPETYHYVAYTKATELAKRAHQQMDKLLKTTWANKMDDLPLATPYEALILASIIEKETAVADERATVASVFVNRLRKGMRLQTDPTVIYGLGERFNGDITRANLKEKTPYNTYRIDGLPPTPIAMPSAGAVNAALNPRQTNYYYFVADGEGGHTFSTTLEEHNQAVKLFLEKSKHAG